MKNKVGTRKFVADVVALLTGRLFIIGIGLVGNVVMARLLGPESKGIVTAILVIPSLIQSFAELGLRQSTMYYIGKNIYDDQCVLSTVSFLAWITSTIGSIVIICLYFWNDFPQKYGWGAILVSVPLLSCHLISQYAEGVLLAKQRIREISIVRVLERVIYLFLMIGLVLLLSDVIGAILATVLAAGVTTIYIIHLIRQYGHLKPMYIPGLPMKFVRLGFVYAVALFVLSLGYRLDVILLERLSTPWEVGIYSIGVNLAELLWLLPTALTTVNFARSAATKDALVYARKTALVMRITFWGGLLPCLVLFYLAPWLIPLVYGNGFAASAVVVQGILPGIWMALIFKVLNSDLAGRGRPEAALWVYGFALSINVCLNLWLIPHYGAVGSAWASSVSYSVGALVYAMVYARMSALKFHELFLFSRDEITRFLSLMRRYVINNIDSIMRSGR